MEKVISRTLRLKKNSQEYQIYLKNVVIVRCDAVYSDRFRRFGGNYASIFHEKYFPDKSLHISC
jgi:hypothetical protein